MDSTHSNGKRNGDSSIHNSSLPGDHELSIRRLTGPGARADARRIFEVMAEVFAEGDESAPPLGDRYIERLLERPDFWAVAAFVDGEPAGGLTAHELPMTRSEETELFVYDLAVAEAYRRKGIGLGLMRYAREESARQGIAAMFVPVESEDLEAIEFYRAAGGEESRVAFFAF